jgi:hypothetical protein
VPLNFSLNVKRGAVLRDDGCGWSYSRCHASSDGDESADNGCAKLTAAQNDRICVRAYCVMLITFEMPRIIPAMQTTLHSMCQNEYKTKYQ